MVKTKTEQAIIDALEAVAPQHDIDIVDVELTGTLTTGMTVADLRGPEPSAEQCHTQVAVKLDFDKFWDLVTDAIERIG